MGDKDKAIKHLKEARRLLLQLSEEGERGVELADAIDMTSCALDKLGADY